MTEKRGEDLIIYLVNLEVSRELGPIVVDKSLPITLTDRYEWLFFSTCRISFFVFTL